MSPRARAHPAQPRERGRGDEARLQATGWSRPGTPRQTGDSRRTAAQGPLAETSCPPAARTSEAAPPLRKGLELHRLASPPEALALCSRHARPWPGWRHCQEKQEEPPGPEEPLAGQILVKTALSSASRTMPDLAVQTLGGRDGGHPGVLLGDLRFLGSFGTRQDPATHSSHGSQCRSQRLPRKPRTIRPAHDTASMRERRPHTHCSGGPRSEESAVREVAGRPGAPLPWVLEGPTRPTARSTHLHAL